MHFLNQCNIKTLITDTKILLIKKKRIVLILLFFFKGKLRVLKISWIIKWFTEFKKTYKCLIWDITSTLNENKQMKISQTGFDGHNLQIGELPFQCIPWPLHFKIKGKWPCTSRSRLVALIYISHLLLSNNFKDTYHSYALL